MKDKQRIIMLEDMLTDLVDGDSWYDIQDNTGLPESRCKEISNMSNSIFNLFYKNGERVC